MTSRAIRRKYKPMLDSLQEGTQIHTVLRYLLDNGSITSMVAFSKYQITRLSSIIYNLRGLGVDIDTDMVFKKEEGHAVHYGVYRVK